MSVVGTMRAFGSFDDSLDTDDAEISGSRLIERDQHQRSERHGILQRVRPRVQEHDPERAPTQVPLLAEILVDGDERAEGAVRDSVEDRAVVDVGGAEVAADGHYLMPREEPREPLRDTGAEQHAHGAGYATLCTAWLRIA
jgi:hypothetical protein